MEHSTRVEPCGSLLFTARNNDLTLSQMIEHEVLTGAVEFTEHVIEQQDGIDIILIKEQFPLCEFERERSRSGLTLGREGCSGHAAEV